MLTRFQTSKLLACRKSAQVYFNAMIECHGKGLCCGLFCRIALCYVWRQLGRDVVEDVVGVVIRDAEASTDKVLA